MEHIDKIEQNILYTKDKLKHYLHIRSIELNRFYTTHLIFPSDKYVLPKETQFFSDALLQGMATLIDYYFIWVAMKLGCQKENVVKIQYRSFDDNQVIKAYNKANKTQLDNIPAIKIEMDSEIFNLSGKKSSEVNINNFWAYYFQYAICNEVSKWGESFKAVQSEKNHEYENLVGDVVFKYFTYLNPFFSSCFYSMEGARYNLYLTINNYLKHNTVPIIIPNIIHFGNERRIYSHFEINNEEFFFLKDSLLKDILLHDFESLKNELYIKSAQKKDVLINQSPIRTFSFIDFIDVDIVNGYINDMDGSLLFFVDGVSFIKTKKSLLVDAHFSLEKTILNLFMTIERSMKSCF
ncbi:hypothetical protein [Dickeya fangzhongdai]|uniref:hypothetical protein n=1 Tax=Dickeya fangzhongdai TaxID=1778540 RepID=UPI0026DFF39D|nr:hypothetical protein [Dickeya fangzhongdai]WKV52156.1 hypothetical protein PL145_08060 [Dickeya fangzhongdai]